MALVTDGYTFFNSLVFMTGYKGINAGSYGPEDFQNAIFTSSYKTLNPYEAFNSLTKTKTTFNVYYKMQGFNPLTNKYEDWHSMGEPLLTPPSGHSLLNISIIATWSDR